MAANGRNRKRGYYASGAINGNLARKLDSRELEQRLERSGQLDFDQQYRQRRETEAERRSRRRANMKAAIRQAQKVSPAAVLGFITVAVMMVFLLLCCVRMNTLSRSISDLKSRISELETEQVSLMSKYDQAFDLATVQAAAEAAGMTQPSDSQTYYIDLPGEDQAVSYRESGDSPLDGLLSAPRLWLDRVVAYFR